jgi:hypothetical protein
VTAASARPARSKTLATWIAVVGGAFGLHRFYLHGLRDPIGWLFPLPTLLGLWGLLRIDRLGQDDRLAWLLTPMLGLTLSAAMLAAIVYGLTPDEKWAARHAPGRPARATGWGPVLGVIAAVMIGAVALTSTIAYGGQRFFEWQLERTQALSR